MAVTVMDIIITPNRTVRVSLMCVCVHDKATYVERQRLHVWRRQLDELGGEFIA